VDDLLKRSALYTLFFFSGLTSLVYQILWTRKLTLILGHSVLAVSSVVSITMAGLALGSLVGGRSKQGEASFQVRRYAYLETFIGLWALLSYPLLAATSQLHLAAASHGTVGLPLYLVGLAGAALVLLPPTAAMGATLPIISVALVGEESQPGLLLSELYGINTLGAFAGAALAGFGLLPILGARISLAGAALTNLMLAFLGWRLSRTFGKVRLKPKEPSSHLSRVPPRSLVAFGLAGVASMIFQIGWTRGLVLTVGSSTYSFAAVLSIFLLGIALGSSLFALLPGGLFTRPSHLGVLLLLGAVTATASILLLGYLPLLFIYVFSWTGGEFARVLALQVGTVALLIGPSCLIMGLLFPAIHQVYGHRDASLGHQVGQFYSANTVGCIIGALLAGFLLIPEWGSQGALQVGVGLQLLASTVFLEWKGRCFALPVGLCCFLLPTWNPGLMAAGSGVYTDSQQTVSLEKLKDERWLPPTFYKDGLSTTVSVHVGAPGRMTVRVNGKVDASLTQTDRQTMYLAGYLGGLFVENPKRAAVIGLGSGMTLEALSHLPSLETIECAELEPAMLEANRFWSGYNGHVLEDPRVQVRITDGRTMLQSASQPYDLIVSEPSNPWIAGVADLYTREFFSVCRERLTQDGVMIQWFHFYGVSEREVGMVFNSFYEAFPHGSVWISAPGDILLVGAKKPTEPSFSNFRKTYEESPILRRRFFEIGLFFPESLMGLQLIDRKKALEFDTEAPLNTDDRPLLEFAAPRHLFQKELVASNLRLLTSHAGPPRGKVPATTAHAWLTFRGFEWIRRWLRHNSESADGTFVRARFLAERSLGTETQQAFKEALDSSTRPDLVAAQWAEIELKSGRIENAVLLYRKALEGQTDPALTSTLQTRLGQALTGLQEFDEAVTLLETAALDPDATDATFVNLAAVLTLRGEFEKARGALKQGLDRNAYSVEARLGLGYLAMKEERWQDAVDAYTSALKLVPDSAEAIVNKGMCLTQLGRREEAIECFQRALRFHPNHPVAKHNLESLSSSFRDF
jgi:spermidine synthase